MREKCEWQQVAAAEVVRRGWFQDILRKGEPTGCGWEREEAEVSPGSFSLSR